MGLSGFHKLVITMLTGLSDFHKLVIIMLKISFPKNKSLQMNYKNYEDLYEYSFNEDLKLAFINTEIQTCEEFEIFMNLLDHHALLMHHI